MKRIAAALLVSFAACGLAACSGESNFPEATGKGSIRAIHAVPTAPEIGFLIEERALDSVVYKANSTPQNWDDLSYNFNFEIRLPDATQNTRIATEPLDVTKDVEYTFVVMGDVDTPTIRVWEIPQRSFDGTATVFEMRIGNAADALGTVDVYVAPEGVAPVLGEQAATLAPGEVSTPADLEEDRYVITVTAEGDPAGVLYRSAPTLVVANQSALIVVFEGDAGDTAPVTATVFNQSGLSTPIADDRFPPTIRFIHATMDLETSDIYDDEMLQNLVVSNLAFGDATGDFDTPVGEIPITFTAAGNPGAILFETIFTAFAGTRVNFYVFVLDDAIAAARVILDRRSRETAARVTFFHGAINHDVVDLYLVDPGESIDDAIPRIIAASYGLQTQIINMPAGSYDLYVTTSGEKTVLDGPVGIDLALGDVVQGLVIDRVDPALAEFKVLPPP